MEENVDDDDENYYKDLTANIEKLANYLEEKGVKSEKDLILLGMDILNDLTEKTESWFASFDNKIGNKFSQKIKSFKILLNQIKDKMADKTEKSLF